jgi:hypothetical protein
MTEVIGNESKTIHRLLEWQIEKFKKNDENPVDVDFLLADEFSIGQHFLKNLVQMIPGCKSRSL